MIDYGKIIRDEIARVEARLKQHVANLIQQTQITNPTIDGNEDGADGWPEGGGSYQRSPRRWQHFGFRSVPPKNAAALMLLVGGGSTAEVTVAEDGTGYGPDPGAEGVALFSTATGAYLTIDKNGEMVLAVPVGHLIKSGGATDFAVKGSTYRTAEHTMVLALATVLGAIGTFATAVGVAVPGVAGAAVTLNTAIVAATNAIGAFEAGAANYLSTVNKLA